ncbi:MAG TPA: hypothetical protein VHM19_23125 [Polyangiales bacterium]|jgi:hypothetical protein|nr:hypothetical protein [Polyangiales bacterium]
MTRKRLELQPDRLRPREISKREDLAFALVVTELELTPTEAAVYLDHIERTPR